ncbi:MAG: sporulation protein [Lachnospiraceae bacterium]|nr:sporulation protein [Lachnospiraceae bacterium]
MEVKMDNNINSTVKSLLDGLNGFVTTKTVVGEPIHVDGAVLIPLIDVTFGVGAGAFSAAEGKKEKGAGGMNGKMSPSSVLVIKDGSAKVINIKDTNTMNKVIDMVPDILAKITKKDKNSEAVDEAIDDIKKENK